MKLQPKQMKMVVYGGMGIVGSAAVYLMLMGTTPTPKTPDIETQSLTGGANTREVSLGAFNNRLLELERVSNKGLGAQGDQLRKIEAAVASMAKTFSDSQQQTVTQAAKLSAQITDLGARITNIERKDASTQRDIALMRSVSTSNGPVVVEKQVRTNDAGEREVVPVYRVDPNAVIYQPAPEMAAIAAPTGGAGAAGPGGAVRKAPVIRSYESPAKKLGDDIPAIRIAAGSIITSFLLTGLDAPTGTKASANPIPVLMRIKREAIMPNSYFRDVVDCHMLGGAYGELSSERVNIRGELVSCVLSDGTIIEGKAKFFVTGPDGKSGIPGRLVSKAGQALSRSFAAGFLQSMADAAVAGAGSGNNQSTGSISLSTDALAMGALGGSSSAFEALAQYYLDLAEQTFPVIEIINQQWVDVVLTSDMVIEFGDHS